MLRNLWWIGIVGILLVNFGCGTLCRRPMCNRSAPAGATTYVPPPPPVPVGTAPPTVNGPIAPAGAFGPPSAFPTVPPQGATFDRPPSQFPTAPPPQSPPSMTPIVPKDQGRVESKWTPPDNRDGNPRIQLYAPEAIDKEPSVNGPKSAPRTTFPPIAQFAEARANVYSGLRPSADGLDWLKANRLGTVVQVRLPGEDDATFKKQVEDRGIRYVAFEVSPTTLTKEKADEFIRIVRDAGAQGLFVFDADGSLAGSMWYLYLRWAEVLDDDAAQLRARPLGLQNMQAGQHRDMWLAVQRLLSENTR